MTDHVLIIPPDTGTLTGNLENSCAHCGHSTAPGSGLFVDRVPILDDREERIAAGFEYPEGEYICRDCIEKYYHADQPDELPPPIPGIHFFITSEDHCPRCNSIQIKYAAPTEGEGLNRISHRACVNCGLKYKIYFRNGELDGAEREGES